MRDERSSRPVHLSTAQPIAPVNHYLATAFRELPARPTLRRLLVMDTLECLHAGTATYPPFQATTRRGLGNSFKTSSIGLKV